MLTVQRVIYDTTDISKTVNGYRQNTGYQLNYVAGKYLYIGAELPFTVLWFELMATGANTVAAAPKVEIWFGQDWHDVVDIIDETVAGGKTLGASGRFNFSTNIMKGWQLAQISSWVTGFPNANIYWNYWTRWSWDANVNPNLRYIGQKFSSDRDLFAYYPDLNNAALMTAFGGTYDASKATWDEQHFMSAEIIARELIGRKIIWSRAQIMDWDRLLEAACHMTAALIYRGLRLPDERVDAMKSFEHCMHQDFFRVDVDADGKLEPEDKFQSTTFLTR